MTKLHPSLVRHKIKIKYIPEQDCYDDDLRYSQEREAQMFSREDEFYLDEIDDEEYDHEVDEEDYDETQAKIVEEIRKMVS